MKVGCNTGLKYKNGINEGIIEEMTTRVQATS